MEFRRGTCLLTAMIAIISVKPSAHAETVQEYLRAFHANPQKMMQRLPNEIDENGQSQPRGYINMDEMRARLTERNQVRSEIISSRITPLSDITTSPNPKDRPENLIEPGPIVTNIFEIENGHLLKGEPTLKPWVDSYWPIYKGLIATRYAESGFPNSGNWQTNFDYVSSDPASAIVNSGDLSQINGLSPAEKYDYVMGDMNFTLTQYSWELGHKHIVEHGGVAKWMGICHGWSGASHMGAKIPDHPVSVTAPDGKHVTFYPQDVKALQSMLWANAKTPTRFIGDRCDTFNPGRDPYGRILDPKCWDVNPAVWHLSVVNQIGANKRSFVMDSTFDSEVWNFPISNYTYSYFNPETFQEYTSAKAAVIPMDQFRLDKFRTYRSPNAKFVVGIYMDVTHLKEINPTRGNPTPPFKTVRFIYDLELDANMNVIGGEWYSNGHPDFIWTYNKNAQALASGDGSLFEDTWGPAVPVSANWTEAARRASQRGTPLYAFIKRVTEVPEAAPDWQSPLR